MADFTAVTAEVTRLAAGLGALYFTVAVVLAAGQAQLAAGAGQPRLLAELQERLLPLVICLAVAAAADRLGADVRGALAGGAADAAQTLALGRALAGFVVNTVIGAAGAGLAAGIALGSFSAQLAAVTGAPDAVSEAGRRLLAVTLTAGLTAASLALAQGLVQLVF